MTSLSVLVIEALKRINNSGPSPSPVTRSVISVQRGGGGGVDVGNFPRFILVIFRVLVFSIENLLKHGIPRFSQNVLLKHGEAIFRVLVFPI